MTKPVQQTILLSPPYTTAECGSARDAIQGLVQQVKRCKAAYQIDKNSKRFGEDIYIIQCAARALKPYLARDFAARPDFRVFFDRLEAGLQSHLSRVQKIVGKLHKSPSPIVSTSPVAKPAFESQRGLAFSSVALKAPRPIPPTKPSILESSGTQPKPVATLKPYVTLHTEHGDEIFHCSPLNIKQILSFEELRLAETNGAEGIVDCAFVHQQETGGLSFEEQRLKDMEKPKNTDDSKSQTAEQV